MRRRVILSPATRAAVFDPPDSHDEAQRRHVLTPGDAALTKRHRRSHNRLGFAVQLALVRDLGRPLQIGEVLPAAVIDTIAEPIGIDPVVFGLYAKREETRWEHTREIIAALSLRPVQITDYRGLIGPSTRSVDFRPNFRMQRELGGPDRLGLTRSSVEPADRCAVRLEQSGDLGRRAVRLDHSQSSRSSEAVPAAAAN